MYSIYITSLFLVVASAGNQESLSEEALCAALSHYTNDSYFNTVKAKYEKIPADLRSLIKAN